MFDEPVDQYFSKALFNAGICPETKVADLPLALIRRLVRMTRDFSAIFYEVRFLHHIVIFIIMFDVFQAVLYF